MTDRTMTATGPAQSRVTKDRWWLFAVLAGAFGGPGTFLALSTVTDTAPEVGGAAILADIQGDRLPIALGAVAGMAAVLFMVLFNVALRRRLREREPVGGTTSMVAGAGLALTAGALFVGLAAVYQLWWQGGGMYDSPDLVAAAFLVADTVPFAAWAGVGLTAGATGVSALRHGAAPRWLGWFSTAMAFVIAAMVVGMVPFMAFMPGSLWLVVTGLGLRRLDRVQDRLRSSGAGPGASTR